MTGDLPLPPALATGSDRGGSRRVREGRAGGTGHGGSGGSGRVRADRAVGGRGPVNGLLDAKALANPRRGAGQFRRPPTQTALVLCLPGRGEGGDGFAKATTTDPFFFPLRPDMRVEDVRSPSDAGISSVGAVAFGLHCPDARLSCVFVSAPPSCLPSLSSAP